MARQDAPESRSAPSAPLQLAELAREVIADLLPTADARQIELGLSADDEGAIHGDADGLRALLRNLIDNALRYAPESSQVEVVVARIDGAVQLRVIDQGPGIPSDERGRVFDRFYRVAGSAAGGSGLGLAIVRSIADAHGASVELGEGPDGRGLQVSVRFGASARPD